MSDTEHQKTPPIDLPELVRSKDGDAPLCAKLRSAKATDREAILNLLAGGSLPTAGVSPQLDHFVVAEAGGEVVAVGGLEYYGSSALLRSVAVEPRWRGSGLARLVVEQLLSDAKKLGVDDVFLLTTTAERYFPRFGFACVTRDDVPEVVRTSVEFSGACPASATVMRRVVAGP